MRTKQGFMKLALSETILNTAGIPPLSESSLYATPFLQKIYMSTCFR